MLAALIRMWPYPPTPPRSPGSIPFYRRVGFVPAGELLLRRFS